MVAKFMQLALGVNTLRNTFETDLNLLALTTSGAGLGRIPDETGQV